ncbi:hypothetical protein WM40_05210 [Robbsia andropogonis]|uniref:Alpha-ribazole phosphatase n=1 Tax=Robbsia andropogonis TaxID=28092 RepID=A0A0F5K393_9BURK|nr:histidine phosphatase family protein [Robbsia andropogonis]KKB64354.1 hypothetical protein WM40_05210 [Robbsia andropogonis]MCP1120630.1 histidine phosphatase family protein [Robbsia andropogonis]MCP1130365.1 histidine phosphatase family protein [Robbsia andropogonis]
MDLVLIRHPAVDVPSGVCYGQTDVALLPRFPADTAESQHSVVGTTDLAIPPQTATIALAVANITAHLRERGLVHACFASPLQRCADVAHALTRALPSPGLHDPRDDPRRQQHASLTFAHPHEHAASKARLPASPVIEPRLAELDFGQWEMQRWDDIPRHQIDAWAADILNGRPHHGESVQMLADRCGAWLRELTTTLDSANHEEETDEPAPPPCLLLIGHAGPIRVLTALALDLPLTATLQWPLDFGGAVTLRHRGSRPSPSWTLRQWDG